MTNLQQAINGLYDIAFKLNEKIKINSNDYTAFEVYANDTEFPVGTTYRQITQLSSYVPTQYLDTQIAAAIPVGMTHRMRIRTSRPPVDSDVVIDWDDGSQTFLGNVESPGVTITGPTSEKEYEYKIEHTYQATGKYIVRIFGTGYYGWDYNIPNASNLTCRIFEGDLPVASHLHNFASTCYNAKRLFYVQINGYDAWCEHADNISYLFSSCTNLLECVGFKRHTERMTDDQIFNHCKNLTNTDYRLQSIYSRPSSPTGQFADCPKLAVNILNLLPDNGFFGTINMKSTFNGSVMLTCSSAAQLAAKLWENPYVTFTNTAQAFTNCSAELRAMVPTSWGGTNTEIEEKLQAGYWKQSTDGEYDDRLDAALSTIKDEILALNARITAD